MTDLSNVLLDSLYPVDIAPNFRVYELTKSELASRLGVDNRFPSDRELRAAVLLARHVLQRLRDTFGNLTPNSVFRGQTWSEP